MSPSTPERRAAGNEPLRDAFDELLETLELRQGDPMMHVALRACAERARASGMPPERFVATLKRVLASRPEIVDRLAAIAVFKRRSSAYEEIVTYAIAAYYGKTDERTGS
jgi:hypothetical protein